MEVWVENFKKQSRKFTIFQTNQYHESYGKQNSNLSLFSIFMRYDSELFQT